MTFESPRPAAAVVFLRDGADALEVLLVRGNASMAVHGGSWVFPGGKVDAGDAPVGIAGDVETARATAVREVWEETGVRVSPQDLRPFSHWTTSTARPKRFATWFFLASLDAGTAIRVDGKEIVDHRWMSTQSILTARHRGEMVLPPPTFISMEILGGIETVRRLPTFLASHVVEHFNPKIVALPEGEIGLYEGDAGYDSLDLAAEGARHRLHMLQSGWSYVRSR